MTNKKLDCILQEENNSKESCDKMSSEKIENEIILSNKRQHTQEWKVNASAITKEQHKNNTHPMLGKHHTEESKNKMSEKLTGIKIPQEVIDKRIATRIKNRNIDQSVIDDYKNGETVAFIVKKYNTGTATVYRILDRNGIDRKTKK